MLKETSESLTGNDRFEGFCIDLIDEIAQHLGFNYTFQIEQSGSYGSKNKETGEWNGMIRELLDHVQNWRLFNKHDIMFSIFRKLIWLL